MGDMAEQRIAVVTGGMGGLGESISTKMADAGYRVVVTYSPSNTKYKSWLEEMKGRGYSFSAFPGRRGGLRRLRAQIARASRPSAARSTSWSTTPASRAT